MSNVISKFTNVKARDWRAAAVFFAAALFSSIFFASGILVTYVSPKPSLEAAPGEKGYMVRVTGFMTLAAAEQLRDAIKNQRSIDTTVEDTHLTDGFVVKVGPFAMRDDATHLKNELNDRGYYTIKVDEECIGCEPLQADSKKR